MESQGSFCAYLCAYFMIKHWVGFMIFHCHRNLDTDAKFSCLINAIHSVDLSNCHDMVPNLSNCHDMAPNLSNCHDMAPNLSNYHDRTPNLSNCHDRALNLSELS